MFPTCPRDRRLGETRLLGGGGVARHFLVGSVACDAFDFLVRRAGLGETTRRGFAKAASRAAKQIRFKAAIVKPATEAGGRERVSTENYVRE